MKKYEILLALAEEDPHSLMVIQSTLEKKGFQVTTAEWSGFTTERIPANDFDLVITDRLTILEKAKELNPEIMAILILATSSRSIPTVDAIRFSPDDYLFKPFGLSELEMRASHCIEKLEAQQKDPQPESYDLRLNEKILNIVKAMSHDVRGSLLSISATLKLLSRGYYGNMDEAVVKKIKELFFNTTGLIGVTEEYLGRSFSVNEDLDTEGESLDLMKDILIPVLKELSSELMGHHLLIDHRLHAMSNNPISIRTNRIWLKMVFRNLLKNALKYGDKEGMIALGFEDHGSCYWLNVYNSGKPIPKEYQKNLFTKFMGNGYHENEKDRANRTGLGLYLIRKVIQRMGGEIWYEAKQDGSNFVFTLPLRSTFIPDSPISIRAPFQLATLGK
jgi:signal transduction histidine kinase